MKKVYILIILTLGLFPRIKDHHFTLQGGSICYAQSNGGNSEEVCGGSASFVTVTDTDDGGEIISIETCTVTKNCDTHEPIGEPYGCSTDNIVVPGTGQGGDIGSDPGDSGDSGGGDMGGGGTGGGSGGGGTGRATLASPVGNATITSAFMANRTCAACSTTHPGTDYAVPIGTAVHATASGVVVRAAVSSSYGNVVVIDHGLSTQGGGHVYTLYGHGSQLNVIGGQTITSGQTIMESGNTGHTTGPHLHYEVIVTTLTPNNPNFYHDLTIRHTPGELNHFLN